MRIAPGALRDFVRTIFARAGCSPPEDGQVADRLVGANLAGHDSHGVIRVSDYVGYLRRDQVRPNREVVVVSDRPGLLVLDGQRGFGQSIGAQAMGRGIARARAGGLAAVALRNCGHLGRIGDWPELAAAAGLVSLHFVNTSGFGLLVAPFGGLDRRLSANPIAAGVPRRQGPPIILDISTCAIAEGKIKVARNQGRDVPAGCIIDAEGRPTTDPRRFYADNGLPPGAILPFGGHKGYGLSVVAEMLAGALTGNGCSHPDRNEFLSNGMFTLLLDPEAFGPRDEFDAEVERFVAFLRTSRTAGPDGRILLPGEIEHETRLKRQAEGLDIDAATWNSLCAAAASVGVRDVPTGTTAASS